MRLTCIPIMYRRDETTTNILQCGGQENRHAIDDVAAVEEQHAECRPQIPVARQSFLPSTKSNTWWFSRSSFLSAPGGRLVLESVMIVWKDLYFHLFFLSH